MSNTGYKKKLASFNCDEKMWGTQAFVYPEIDIDILDTAIKKVLEM